MNLFTDPVFLVETAMLVQPAGGRVLHRLHRPEGEVGTQPLTPWPC